MPTPFRSLIILFFLLASAGSSFLFGQGRPMPGADPDTTLIYAGERHFSNIQQLTHDGGEFAEAYFSFDGKKLVFQHRDLKNIMCDQIFWGPIPETPNESIQYKMESNGLGRTTCSYFLPGDSLILYASTQATVDTCPAEPDKKKIGKYVWPLYNAYEIYVADLHGHVRRQLTKNDFYDAEATISPKGDRIIFTSTRNGDIDLYTMNLDGTDVKQVTNTLGYDGGANFSPDGSMIVWRASRPATAEEMAEYKSLLAQGLVAPTHMEVWVANADGSNAHQVTNLPGANWAPAFTPTGKKIIFSSNFEHDSKFPFNLYLINVDGTGLEKITESSHFDAFPMFSPDGKRLVFCSNRHNGGGNDINIFIADWKD